jgi:hypothetical protein
VFAGIRKTKHGGLISCKNWTTGLRNGSRSPRLLKSWI